MPTLLLGAAGLSQKDVALSRRAEEQLEQERRDAELAARLQEEDEEAGKSGFFFARFKKTQGQKNSKNVRPQKNSRAILNKKLSVLEST